MILDLIELGLQPLERLGCIAGQPVGVATVGFELGLLPVKVGEPLLGSLQLVRQRGHPVAMGAGVVAPVRQFVARFGELLGERCLRLLRSIGRLLGRVDPRLGGSRLLACGVGRCGGIAPAGKQQPRLGHTDLVAERLVALGLLGLPPQRGDLRVEPGHQVLEPGEVGFGLLELALGVAPADMQARDSRRLLEHHPPLGRLGGNYRGDLALANQRGRMRAGRGIGEHQRHVLRAHVAAVDAVGATRPALDSASDFEFLARAIGGMQDDLGEIARRSLRGAGEDHVVHPARAQRLGRVLAHHPADCLEKVGLAAAVGADDAGQPRLDAQLSRLDKALEARQAELAKEHCLSTPPFALPRAGVLQHRLELVPFVDVLECAAVELEGWR